MPKLEIVIADPEARQVRQNGTTWLLSGCGEDAAARLERSGNRQDEIEAEICTQAGDATVVKVAHTNGRAESVSAWRGPTAMHELFRLQNGDGDLVIADHFRSALARLPASERAPSDDAVVDHFLFRATPGHDTYARGVARVGRGERIKIELPSGKATGAIFQKLEEAPVSRSVPDYLDDVDRALDDVMSPYREREGVASLFSGGVDSTLLHSYLGPKTAALNLVMDSAESGTAMEAEYARSAAGLLGLDLVRQPVRQADFLTDLEDATEKAATPLFMGMLAVFGRAFANDHRTYVSGWNADTVFGCAARYYRVASCFANPLMLWCLGMTAPAITRRDAARRNVWRERLEKLRPAATRLSMDPCSMNGLGAKSETYTEFDLAEMLFGRDAVARRLEKRFEALIERVGLSAPRGDRFLRHLEIYSLMDLMSSYLAPQLRHIAMANGKSVLIPYVSGPVVRSALRVPVGDRFIRGLEGKYLLKRLLKRRLPAYPIGQRKGTTALVNFPRYYKSGPLSGIWERYDVPDFITGDVRDRIVSAPLNLTNSAITFAVWQRRVAENPNLSALPTERRFEWTC